MRRVTAIVPMFYMQTSYSVLSVHSQVNPGINTYTRDSVLQRALVAVVKKTSLHFDCLKTADRLAQAGYSMTWLRGLLYTDRDIACLLIQLNCTEL
jgi:hypothetical protein